MPRKTKEEKDILNQLAKLGGERFQESDIEFKGTKLILPSRWTAKKAIDTLSAYMEQEEMVTRFHRMYMYRPYDGAAAVERTIRLLTGMSGIQKGTASFFGESPPNRVSIKTDVNETMDIPWGGIEIDIFEGSAYIGSQDHPEYGPLFNITVEAPRKYRPEVEGFFNLVQTELLANSIYRGKIFDGQDEPEFLDLRGVNPDQIVYSEEVLKQLDTNMWSMIRHTSVHRAQGLPLKRAVLLHGEYGTGKTLAAFRTALMAKEYGWTFVYCRPGKDDLHKVMQTARLYQPAVVFFEDVDTVSGESESRDNVSRLLDVFDGINAKGTELLVVLTTNHPERIHKGMVRPGRLDSVIEIGALDSPGTEKLIRAVCGDVVGELDMEPIADAMEGFAPAYVKEAIDRASRYAIARTGAAPEKLETPDFVHAALGLRDQLAMQQDAHELSPGASLDAALMQTVRTGISGAELVDSTDSKFRPYFIDTATEGNHQ